MFEAACSDPAAMPDAAMPIELRRSLPRRLAGQPRVELVADPAQRLGRNPRRALGGERAVAPRFLIARVEIGEHAAREVRERDAVAAVAERVVDVAVIAAHAHGAMARKR